MTTIELYRLRNNILQEMANAAEHAARTYECDSNADALRLALHLMACGVNATVPPGGRLLTVKPAVKWQRPDEWEKR